MDNLIILEFNELCPALTAKFMEEGRLPNLQRLKESSVTFVTDAEESHPLLEPWIQWLTIHSGMRASKHGMHKLGDGRELPEKCIARILSDQGVKVGVFGSMNTNYSHLSGYYVPDPWDTRAQAEPDSLQPFFEIVSRQVQESASQEGLSKGEMLRFGSFMLRNGLRPTTIADILRQLWAERQDAGLKWRRAVTLEKLQYDLFRRLHRKLNIQFATFFCNSTAHFQHYFWRNMDPAIFDLPPSAEEHPSLREAIHYGYEQMDVLVGQFLRDFPDARFVLLTALSQQPWTSTTKCTFRPRSFDSFLRFCGLSPAEIAVQPAMAEEFHLRFASADAAAQAESKIAQLLVSDRPAMRISRKGAELFGGCAINERLPQDAQAVHAVGGKKPFSELFQPVHGVRSGRHHPDGMFWIQNGRGRVVEEKLPLVDVAPTLLAQYQVAAPEYMNGHAVRL